jgi:hypothetical protein
VFEVHFRIVPVAGWLAAQGGNGNGQDEHDQESEQTRHASTLLEG